MNLPECRFRSLMNNTRDGKRDYVIVRDQFKEGNLKDVMEFVASDLPQTKLQGYIKELDFIPTRNVILPVDSAKVIANGTVKPRMQIRSSKT